MTLILKIKPFDHALSLPEIYADSEEDLPSIINKFIEKKNKLIVERKWLTYYYQYYREIITER
jgi:hypothetical protein